MSNVIQFPGKFNDWSVAELQLIDLIGIAMGRTWEKDALLMMFAEAKANPDMCTDALHEIADSIVALNSQGLPVDVVTVSGHLDEYGLLEEVGGLAFLSNIIMGDLTA
jgi:replicative DNA helicase